MNSVRQGIATGRGEQRWRRIAIDRGSHIGNTPTHSSMRRTRLNAQYLKILNLIAYLVNHLRVEPNDDYNHHISQTADNSNAYVDVFERHVADCGRRRNSLMRRGSFARWRHREIVQRWIPCRLHGCGFHCLNSTRLTPQSRVYVANNFHTLLSVHCSTRNTVTRVLSTP